MICNQWYTINDIQSMIYNQLYIINDVQSMIYSQWCIINDIQSMKHNQLYVSNNNSSGCLDILFLICIYRSWIILCDIICKS